MGQSVALPLAVTTKYVERFGNRHFRGAVVSMQGWRVEMEDSHVADLWDHYGLFGVLDGHSGATCAARCAHMLKDRISKAPLPIADEALQRLVLDVDAEFLTTNPMDDSGSTAVFCVVTPTAADGGFHAQVANVGDSRILLGGSAPRPLTADHKPSLPAEAQRICAAGGHVAEDRVNGELAVSRAMGDRPYKRKEAPKEKKGKKAKRQKVATEAAVATGSEDPTTFQVIAQPDVTHADLKAGDWLLVACDGIFEPESFTNEEVTRFVTQQLAKGGDLGQVLCALCTEALTRGSTDNMTAMLVQIADGTAFQRDGELVPGPFLPDMGKAKRSYFRFAKEFAGLGPGEVLELRYDLLTRRLADLAAAAAPQNGPPSPSDFNAMTIEQLRKWLADHGCTDDLPVKRGGLVRACREEHKRCKFYTEDDVGRLQEELEWYKGGPPAGLVPQDRTAWFAGLVTEADIGGGGAGGEAEDDDEEEVDLNSIPPEQLKRLLDQGLLKELQEEIGEMTEEGILEAVGQEATGEGDTAEAAGRKGKKRRRSRGKGKSATSATP